MIPAWVRQLAMPVWVSEPDGKLCFLNGRAEALLGLSVEGWEGRPCWQVIAGRGADGSPFCGRQCSVRCAAHRGAEVEPIDMQVRLPGMRGRWLKVVCIPVMAPDGQGPWVVHCASSTDREHRFERYLRKVASRTPLCEGEPTGREPLTPRESEVLRHLAQDEDLPTIAAKLYVSHATVRNHVQHILTKMRVHSTAEAIALHLLDRCH